MDRAQRRHEAEKRKERWRRRLRERFVTRAPTGRDVGRRARTPQPCSDPWCCGNRRTLEGPSRAELAALEAAR